MTLHRAWIATTLSLCLCVTSAHAARVVLPRAGQVGLGAQLGYGALLQGGTLGGAFNGGASYAVHLRYRMRYERGFGLTFSGERFDVRTATTLVEGDDSTIQPERLNTTLSGLEFYQMFGTRTPTTKYLLLGAGLAQNRVKLNDGETEISGKLSGDGLYFGAGAGVERFVWQSMAWDLSVRYNAIFKDGKPNSDVQAALGIMWYASY